VFWQNTEHWDTLLLQRAQISGSLVTSSFTRQAIQKFKTQR
jgi:methylglutaconyl-CoA hydratase